MGLDNSFAWLRWLFEFNLAKYIALLCMTIGPLFFIYRLLFLNANLTQTIIFSLVSFVAGVIIWTVNWDPYS